MFYIEWVYFRPDRNSHSRDRLAFQRFILRKVQKIQLEGTGREIDTVYSEFIPFHSFLRAILKINFGFNNLDIKKLQEKFNFVQLEDIDTDTIKFYSEFRSFSFVPAWIVPVSLKIEYRFYFGQKFGVWTFVFCLWYLVFGF